MILVNGQQVNINGHATDDNHFQRLDGIDIEAWHGSPML